MNKTELRKLIRDNPLSEEYIHEASKLIQQKVIQSEEFSNCQKIFCYVSVEGEVSTSEIIKTALKNKEVYVPKCTDSHTMVAIRINSVNDLVKNRYGIPEPLDINEPEDKFDLIIVPCMCAGKNGERLGHGAGYYDSFLSKSKAKTVCLCFEERLRDDIVMEDHDIFMDEIITEKDIYYKAA